MNLTNIIKFGEVDKPEVYSYRSIEIYLLFRYGAITWEWKEGLRSFLYPLIISFVYWILEALGLDQPYNLVSYYIYSLSRISVYKITEDIHQRYMCEQRKEE